MQSGEYIPGQSRSPQFQASDLLPHNALYFHECVAYINALSLSDEGIDPHEMEQLILIQLREAQLDGKRAEQVYGDSPEKFCDMLIVERKKMFLGYLLKQYFHFPLYSVSLFLFGYSFFIFLLAATRDFTLGTVFLIPMPLSLLGLFAGYLSVHLAFLKLFYERQKAKIMRLSHTAFFKRRENLMYVWIASSFVIPYVMTRLGAAIIYAELWMMLLAATVLMVVSAVRFRQTDTSPA